MVWRIFRTFAPNMKQTNIYLASKPRYEILGGLRAVANQVLAKLECNCSINICNPSEKIVDESSLPLHTKLQKR